MSYNGKTDRRSTVNSFGWKLMERVASQGIGLVVQIFLARIIAPEDFGSLAIIVALTNYAAIFVQSGLATAIIQKQDLKEIDVSTVLAASMLIAGVMYIGLFIASPFIASFYALPELKWALRVLALILFLNGINAVQTAILSRKMKFKKLFFRSIVAVPIAGATGIVMALLGCGIWALVAHHLVNMLTVVVFMSLDKDTRVPLRFSRESAKSIYSFSWKILLTSMVTGFHDMFRTMVIGKEYSTSDLAQYDKAYTYSGYVVLIVNNSISSVLLPVFSRAQTEIEKLRSMARRSVRLSAFVMAPVLLGVAAVSEPLVYVLLTEKWLPCVPFLVLFCLLRLPGCIMTADKQVYYALGKSGINLAYEIGLFAANMTALFVTVPFGPMAIAIGATVVELFGGFAIWCISSKIYGYRVRDRICDIGRSLLNAVIMAVVVWLAGSWMQLPPILELLIEVPIGVTVYVLLSWLLRDESLGYCVRLVLEFLKKKKGESL